MPDLGEALLYYVVFLLSTTLHEGAHAWAALRGGDPTAYHGGQVSIDPMPHIRREPIGMVVLPIISVLISGWPFGFASAPYDPAWARRHPRRAAGMAIAGPGANLALIILAAVLINLGMALEILEAPSRISFGHVTSAVGGGVAEAVGLFLGVVFSLNLVLFILNMLPLPPLDGSGAIPLLLSREATRRYQDFMWNNRGVGWLGILVAWQVFDFVFNPVFLLAVNLLYPGVSYG